jgi:DNA polymerase-3 subunit delta'
VSDPQSHPQWRKEGKGRSAAAEVAPGPAVELVVPLGQDGPLQRLLRQARTGAMHHGILIAGARGGGKTTVANWLTAALLCPSELDQDGPCGVCSTCRRVASGNHPDVHLLARARDQREVDDLDKSLYVIKVDQVREMQATLARHAVAGGARVLVIDEAERLDESGQNALLKTLEEPGEAVWILLLTAQPEALLPTVRSRVQSLRLRPLTADLLLRELQRRRPRDPAQDLAPDPAIVDRVMRLCRGSLGRCLELCTEQMVQLHDLVLAVLGDIQGLRPVAVTRAVLEGQKGRGEAAARVRTFLQLLRAELSARMQEHEAAGEGAYAAAQSESWCRCIELTMAAEQDLQLHIPPEQALCACLLSMQSNE